MKELTPRSRVKAIKEHVSCNLAGEAVILNLQNGIYYGLDPLGAMIWSQIQSPRTVDQVVDMITEEYEVDRDKCIGDLKCFLRDLEQNGLVDVEYS